MLVGFEMYWIKRRSADGSTGPSGAMINEVRPCNKPVDFSESIGSLALEEVRFGPAKVRVFMFGKPVQNFPSTPGVSSLFLRLYLKCKEWMPSLRGSEKNNARACV